MLAETIEFAPACYCFSSGCFLANMYLLLPQTEEESRAVVIDPWRSETLCEILRQNGISDVLILLTHEHFDHTTGVSWLKERLTVELICQEQCAESIANIRRNRSLIVMGKPQDRELIRQIGYYTCKADQTFSASLTLPWDGREWKLIHTPGHTQGSCCMRLEHLCFCGDNALLGLPTITRFPGGNLEVYEQQTLPYLFALPDDTWILPGHGVWYQKRETVFHDGAFCKIEMK